MQLHNQLVEEKKQSEILRNEVKELQLALETADISFEMFKQKCLIQFEDLQNELYDLRQHHSRMNTNELNTTSCNHNQELKKFATSIEEQNRNIADVDLRLQILENTHYDGNLLWKIDDFRNRRQQTLAGDIHALHSAPCYTSEYGYKFCLRVYLDGDGAGQGTHLSLFLVIMKSEHDNILKWPFQKKVKFTLINQQNRNRDHVDEIIPNKNSESFQKPRKDMNIASGLPLFIEINRLENEGFLKDNSLLFQATVH